MRVKKPFMRKLLPISAVVLSREWRGNLRSQKGKLVRVLDMETRMDWAIMNIFSVCI